VEKDDHCMQLGKLVATLHSLEFTLRAFLLKHNESREPSVALDAIAPGGHVPENSFTNYDTLGMLLKKFNDIVACHASACSIDPAVVDARDMLAHGRIAGNSPEVFPMELLKFGKPTLAGVPVEAMVTVDVDWLRSKASLVENQVRKVIAASDAMGQQIMETI